MNNNSQLTVSKERYIRLPHWVAVAWTICEIRDNAHGFELKATEHRARKAHLRICGFDFEAVEPPPLGSCIQLEIRLSENNSPIAALARVVNVEKSGNDGSFRVKGSFLAATEAEIDEIARFARKYF